MTITLHASVQLTIEIRTKYQDILGPSPTISKLLDTLVIKKLERFILELKQHIRENKLQNANYKLANIHHGSNENFQG